MKKYSAILMALLMLCACTKNAEQPTAEISNNGNTVTVSAESPILNKIKYETIALKPFCDEFRTVGTVQAETGKFAEVNVPFDGRVTRANVSLGAKVHAGQSLFELSSPDFLEASKEYFQNLQNYEKAKNEYDRKKVLSQHGIASQKELEEAFTELENARHDKEYSAASLKAYGTDASTMKMGQAMHIVAPISGEVVKSDLTVGSFVKADSDPMITIADLHKVWINARVKEHFINQVSQGGKAEIRSESDPDQLFEGQILNVGNLVDEETRSVQIVISCDNPELRLKHGMYVSVHFLSEAKESVVVPSTAVFQGEQRSYVFVCTSQPNVFERREVELGMSNDNNTEISIRKGLEAGERIIAEGGLYLND